MERTGQRCSTGRAVARRLWTSTALLLAGFATPVAASDFRLPLLNTFGMPGGIETPAATALPDAEIALTAAAIGNNLRGTGTFQVLPFATVALRYASIPNFAPPGTPDETLFDRSADLQIQLLREQGFVPSIAVGFRDFIGTGLYSSEYVVATSTAIPSLTVSAGIAWGRMAGDPREFGAETGGQPRPEDWFTGSPGAFASIAWDTPIDGLTLLAEYSPDTYARERLRPESTFTRKSDFNFGLEYRPLSNVGLRAFYAHDGEFGFQLSLVANPTRPPVAQNLGAGPIPVNPRPPGAPMTELWAGSQDAADQLSAAIAEALAQEGIRLEAASYRGDAVEVRIVNTRWSRTPQAVGRTARILATAMPPSVETFAITPIEDGLPTTTVTIERSTIEDLVDRPDAGLRSWQATSLQSARPAIAEGTLWERPDAYPDFRFSILPVPSFILFGRDDRVRVTGNLQVDAGLALGPGLSASARITQPFVGIFDDPGEPDPNPNVPVVRRDASRYASGSEPILDRLTIDYVTALPGAVYARASAGYLERMYAGVSGELLYRPANANWAAGVEVNYVQKRDPTDIVGFDDYDVVTGHASLYWQTGFAGLEAQIDAGRYLAGDWGATFSLSRRFANGWELGGFFTLTEISASDFGEGSFDKGVFVSIPLNWATPFETRTTFSQTIRSLSRDGGARLNVANRLYPTLRDQNAYGLERNWGAFWQ